MSLILWLLGGLVGLHVVWTAYLAIVLRWEDERTVGLAYCGLDPAGRDRFKRRLRLHARLPAPVLGLAPDGRFRFVEGKFESSAALVRVENWLAGLQRRMAW